MQTIDFAQLPLKPHDTLLDLGCGEGRHTIGALWHQPQLRVFGVDLCLKDLNTAKQRHEEFDANASQYCLYIQATGYALPFADHSFDHIVCSEVLEHIEHYPQFLNEMHRLLKPGGTLSLSVPRYWPEKICWALSSAYHQVEGGHIRIFNSQQLKQEVQDLAFTYHKKHWAHALHVPYWWLRCLFWRQGDNFLPVRLYHKLLVWDLLKKPWLTQTLDKLLNPIMGKSVVMYFSKPNDNAHTESTPS